ncbi:MAG: xylulokinase [Saprospiraceae bacterium]|jgi:xylulokinase
MYFLGYDIGSSSVKAALLEASSNTTIASAQFPKTEMSMIAHQPGWAEQNPEDWWNALQEVTREILETTQIDSKEITAIGISYQMHGLVVVDENQEVLRPSIIWCDSRAVEIGDQAHQDLGVAHCQDHLLNSPGNFTASKLAWVKENEPEVFKRISKFMLPGDFIAMKLSSKPQTTISGLSEGIFYNFKEERPSQKLLELYGIPEDYIAEIVPTFGDQSEVSQEAAMILGLNPGTKITYRAGDQPNNALSLNVLKPGELAATAGTSGVIYGITDALKSDAASRVNSFAHVNHSQSERKLGILLCINGTGIMYSWANKNLSVGSYEEMNDLASVIPVGSEGLIVLPFGNGAERILENKNLGAQIEGLELNIHTKSHILRAIQEGIACSMRYGTDIMKEMGVTPTVLRAGKANLFQSPLFRQALANLVNATIELYDTDGAAGAARGAGIGLGYYTEETAFDGLQILERITPNEDQEAYEILYRNWKAQLNSKLKHHS